MCCSSLSSFIYQTHKHKTTNNNTGTADTLKKVEQDAALKFEASARAAADQYAMECDRVLAELKTEQTKQDILADELERQIKTAEAKLKSMYKERLDEYRQVFPDNLRQSETLQS